MGFNWVELTPEEIQAVVQEEERIGALYPDDAAARDLELARLYASQQLYLDEVAALDRVVTAGYPDHIDPDALLDLRNALRSAGFDYGAATYYEDVVRTLAPAGTENADLGSTVLLDDILNHDSRVFRISGDLELARDVDAQRSRLRLPGRR